MEFRLTALALVFAACAARPMSESSKEIRTTSADLPVRDGTLHFEHAGSGDALVFIHGGFGDRRMWDEQFAAFADRYHVIRYDHRGFGRSSIPGAEYSPAKDLVALLDHLRVERAHLVGNSLGGTLAIDFALLHPARVRSLVLVGTGPNGYAYPEDYLDRFRAVIATAERDLVEGVALWKAHPMIVAARERPDVWRTVEQMIDDNQRILRMEHWPGERLDPPAITRLGEIAVPALVVVGSRDEETMQRTADVLAREIRGAHKLVLGGTDHLPQLEAPDAFNAALREFLAGQE
ncbi:MAG: alpha/beta fold hydrolase [Planctomycetota bacterium]